MFSTAAVLPCALLAILPAVFAQQFIPPPKDITSVLSKNYPGASISYKENTICETTPGVRAWSGYVHLPSSLNVDASYDTSLFFWYFESKNNSGKAPTTLYLPGGPGASFLDGASGFPCIVNADSNSTILNPWSWNQVANMLYIDTPVQTGYSYTKPQNGTMDFLTGGFTPLKDPNAQITTNLTTVPVTLSSQNPADTLNTTQQVQRTLYLFAQIWFQDFSEYKTENKEINIWGYSYSGFMVPATFAYFQRQNEKILNGTSTDPKAIAFQLGTVGMNNGCTDTLSQAASYPEFAYNNTYGVQLYSKEVYDVAKANLTAPGGCFESINKCRTESALGDPNGLGTNDTVNSYCALSTQICYFWLQGAYIGHSDRSPFDLSVNVRAAFPPEYPAAYYNQRWVQEALGVPVNFTLSAATPAANFFVGTGDPIRYDAKADLEYLASTGVNIALVYGDRDYRCNWLGAENVSLNMNYPAAQSFRSAGYAPISTNASYEGGLVRQHGNVSFSRVFEAGHAVNAYQPETVFRIYERAISRRDIATGTVAASSDYSSSGPASCFGTKNVLMPGPEPVCYLYDTGSTCTAEELEALANGTAVVEDYVVTLPGSGSGGKGSGGNSTGGGGSVPKNDAAGRLGASVLGVWLAPLVLGAVLLAL